jgi:hypothetical protein
VCVSRWPFGAATDKYLFRIEGPAAADDVILEIKEVQALPERGVREAWRRFAQAGRSGD